MVVLGLVEVALPLKLKLFCWIMMENKIITIANYMRRGSIDPNMCLLCFREAETIVHLMVSCPFTQDVWRELKKVYPYAYIWNFLDLHICFKNWFSRAKGWFEIPIIACWEIWIHKNHVLFQDKKKNYVYRVIYNIELNL